MHRKLVLLVEKDSNDETLILRTLLKHRLDDAVVVVHDGAEALEWLFRTGRHADRVPAGLPHVVLTALDLPGIDGFELLKRVRSDPRTARLPIVVLDSSQKEQDVIRSYALGANSFVRKPEDFESFCEAVVSLGRYWLRLNEPPAADAG